MKFLLAIIYNDESLYADATPDDIAATFAAHGEFGEAAGKAGEVFVGGEGLQPIATATTVRVRDGERMLTDGPYAETKEQLGGYYLLECKDLDDALNWAALYPPGAEVGAVEVRPVMDYAAMEGQPRRRGERRLLTGPQYVLVDRPVPARVGTGGRRPRPHPRRPRPRRGGGPGRRVLTALERWPRDGLPDNPGGAGSSPLVRNRALDRYPVREALGLVLRRARGRVASARWQ